MDEHAFLRHHEEGIRTQSASLLHALAERPDESGEPKLPCLSKGRMPPWLSEEGTARSDDQETAPTDLRKPDGSSRNPLAVSNAEVP